MIDTEQTRQQAAREATARAFPALAHEVSDKHGYVIAARAAIDAVLGPLPVPSLEERLDRFLADNECLLDPEAQRTILAFHHAEQASLRAKLREAGEWIAGRTGGVDQALANECLTLAEKGEGK